ncbi:MAG TPA: RNA methyltransferase [Burkholderiales bacterium]
MPGLKRIESRDNAQVKALVKLAASASERRRTGTTLIEGERLVGAYRDSGGTAETIAVGESAYARPEIRSLVDAAPARVKLLLSDRVVEKVSQVVTASGVVAVVKAPKPPEIPREVGAAVLIENLQDPGNLGSILRSAAAAGIREIFLSPGTVFAWSPKTVRAGMGAHFFLTIHENVDLADIARRCKGRVIATEPRAKATLYETRLDGNVAWLFGNEGAGVSEAARRIATDWVRIPMPGASESLNVAAAAAICLFEQVRQNQ